MTVLCKPTDAVGCRGAKPEVIRCRSGAVSVDASTDSRSLARRAKVNAVLFLEDRGHLVIERYGLLDYTLWAPVPYPATYLIDRNGIVNGGSSRKTFAFAPVRKMFSVR